MIYVLSLIIFPAHAAVMIVNVLRLVKVTGKYGWYVFDEEKGATKEDWAKVRKYMLHFFLAALSFVFFIYLMAYLQYRVDGPVIPD